MKAFTWNTNAIYREVVTAIRNTIEYDAIGCDGSQVHYFGVNFDDGDRSVNITIPARAEFEYDIRPYCRRCTFATFSVRDKEVEVESIDSDNKGAEELEQFIQKVCDYNFWRAVETRICSDMRSGVV